MEHNRCGATAGLHWVWGYMGTALDPHPIEFKQSIAKLISWSNAVSAGDKPPAVAANKLQMHINSFMIQNENTKQLECT